MESIETKKSESLPKILAVENALSICDAKLTELCDELRFLGNSVEGFAVIDHKEEATTDAQAYVDHGFIGNKIVNLALRIEILKNNVEKLNKNLYI